MSALKVRKEQHESKGRENGRENAGSQEAAQPNQVALTAAVFEAVSRLSADGETTGVSRDDIPDGSAYTIELAIVARIQGQILRRFFDVALTTGHKSTRASSATPQIAKVVAAILAKLNAATRAAVVAQIVSEFAATGELPEVAGEIETVAEEMLKGLRQAKQVEVRGKVDCKAVASQPPLSIFAGANGPNPPSAGPAGKRQIFLPLANAHTHATKNERAKQ